MLSDVDSFIAKPVFDLVITAYDHESIVAVLLDQLVV
jgi:hypothetical protein